VQREVTTDFCLELPTGKLARDIRTLEGDLRILGRLKHYLAQLTVDDLLLLFGKHVAGFNERVGTNPHLERSRADCAGG
jgi:hypothetical protein